jgi:hypothetical protein
MASSMAAVTTFEQNMEQDLVPMKMVMILIITLWLFNIAMETGPSIDVFL